MQNSNETKDKLYSAEQIDEAVTAPTDGTAEAAVTARADDITDKAISSHVDEIAEDAISTQADEIAEKAISAQTDEIAEEAVFAQADEIAEEAISSQPGSHTVEASPKKKRGIGKWILLAAAVLILALFGIYKVYMDVSYKPAVPPKEVEAGDLNVKVNDNMLSVRNTSTNGRTEKIGIIFYSALRVEAGCYFPLMVKLSQYGYDCFLPTAFGNQTYLNAGGADKVIRKYKSVTHWYLAGHIEGCDPAAQYAAANPDKIEGLIWLGGYTNINLSRLERPLLSIDGTEDTIHSGESKEKAKSHDPADAVYEVIEGGNSTGFTNTVLLKGDSKAKIDAETQQEITAGLMDSFIREHYTPIFSSEAG